MRFIGAVYFYWLQIGYILRIFCSQLVKTVGYFVLLIRVKVTVCVERGLDFFVTQAVGYQLGEKPSSTKRLAWLCPYGIINTNGKIP